MIRYWKWLLGDSDSFKLEVRIFHAVCVALVICIFINIPIAWYLNTPELSILLTVITLVAGGLLYLSRFKRLHQISSTIFQVFVAFALVGNYYYNSGINGPSYGLFLIAFVVSVVTVPPKQYYIWLPLNLLVVASLLTIEFIYPDLIKLSYRNTSSRYLDFLYSYLALAAFALLLIGFVKNAFNRQRHELLAQSAALEEANQTKSKLLSIIGHDVKEPLASLQGYLELLTEFDLDEQEQQEMKHELLTMTKNTSLMLSNILAWAQSQGHVFNPDLKPLTVKETLAPVIELAVNISRKKDISLTVDLPEELVVKADAQMLALIVRNLLMNAIKFTPGNGHVWLYCVKREANIIITVKDDGIGIPEELHAKIFSVDTRPRRGTVSEKGSGLGLMLCKEFATLMNGTINFTSAAERGSSFFLTLPAIVIKSGAIPRKFTKGIETPSLN